MSNQAELLLTEKELTELWKQSIGHYPDDKLGRMRQSAQAQLAKGYEQVWDKCPDRFRKALEQSRKGEPLDLSEEGFELFSAIQADGVLKAQVEMPELREKLIEWIASYKDVAERNALAETPKESAENLVKTFIEPLIKDAREPLLKEIKDLEGIIESLSNK